METQVAHDCLANEEPGNREPRIEKERRRNSSFSVLGSPFPGFRLATARAVDSDLCNKIPNP